jgi:hypothetical protein
VSNRKKLGHLIQDTIAHYEANPHKKGTLAPSYKPAKQPVQVGAAAACTAARLRTRPPPGLLRCAAVSAAWGALAADLATPSPAAGAQGQAQAAR